MKTLLVSLGLFNIVGGIFGFGVAFVRWYDERTERRRRGV